MSVALPIEEDPRFRRYTATAGQTVFSIPFPFQQAEDVSIQLFRDGKYTEISRTTFTIRGEMAPAGGSVTFNAGRSAGDVIAIVGSAILERLSSVVRDGRFKSKLTDDELDRNRIIQQEQRRDIGRAFKVPYGGKGGFILASSPSLLLHLDAEGNLIASETPMNEKVLREAADLALASLIGQAGQIEVPLYDTCLAASLANIKPTINAIRTSGYSAVGDGGEWPLAYSVPDTGTLMPWQFLSNVGSPSGTRRWELKAFIVALEMFGGGVHHTASENSDAIDACMAYIDVGAGARYTGGACIQLNYGTYAFARTIQLKRTVILQGFGSGHSGGDATVLTFPASTTGIIVHRYNTLNDGVISPATTAADGSIIRNLRMTGGGGDQGIIVDDAHGMLGHGIWLRARATIEEVIITNFACNGLNVWAQSGGGGSIEGNANLWRANNVAVLNNGWHGLFTQGADANAGAAYGINARNNGRWGISDRSFLGNTYIACHTASNGLRGQVSWGGNRYYLTNAAAEGAGGITEPGTDPSVWALRGAGGVHPIFPLWVNGHSYARGGSYYSDNANARNMFMGCYSESDQPPALVSTPAMIIGGLHAAVAEEMEGEGVGNILAVNSSGLNINGRCVITPMPSSVPFSIGKQSMVFGGSIDYFWSASGPREVGGLGTGLGLMWSDTDKCYKLRHANVAARTPITITATDNTVFAGRSSPLAAGRIMLENGVWIGSQSLGRLHSAVTSVPSSGEYARGDIAYNSNPVPGASVGWICTTGGIAGSTAVFKTFGTIAT